MSGKASVGESHAAESHLEGDVSILADEVFTGEEDSAKAIVDDLLSHLCGISDRDRVSVDHSESLLIDGVLRAGGGDLLLVVVAVEVILDLLIDDETGLEVMDMFTVSSLAGHIAVDINFTAHLDFGELGVDIEGEGSEFADVDRFSGTELVIQVLDEGSPDNEHLCLGFKRLLLAESSHSGNVMLSREVTRL